ncbi:MAG: ferric reductase-like transmembrane domain-containing protein [Halioglobus sp.]
MLGITALVVSLVLLGSLLPEDLSLRRWVAAFFAANGLVSMALAFVLATRHEILESIFGGLDKMYQVHRWAGIWAVFSIFMHWWLVPQSEIERPDLSLAELGSDTGEWATWLLVFLICISFLKILPYRWWKWTHRLMGLVFIVTVLHFVFAIKPFGLFSPAGIAMSITSIVGLYAWWYYVSGQDTSKRYIAKVQNIARTNDVVTFEAKPLQGMPQWKAGQFAFVSVLNNSKLSREAHPFTIANHNNEGLPRFAISAIGDNTKALNQYLAAGDKVELEMPYGRFEPSRNQRHQIWMGAGIGITPFLAWLQSLITRPNIDTKATLYYVVRNRKSATFENELNALCEKLPQIHLRLIYSENGRLTPEQVAEHLADEINDSELYFCGPSAMRESMQEGLESLGMPTNRVHYELFDFREVP